MSDATRPVSLKLVADVGCTCAAKAVELGFANVAAGILQATAKLLAEGARPSNPSATA